ncbi:hypothetical protein BGX28_000988 [Mortierella sp. GBA30]|nr:hypothetical protein BGX28_000988 [Mortierella sp. GBA30]
MKHYFSILVFIIAILTVSTRKLVDAINSTVPWDYGEGPDGHVHWGLLDPSYVTCDRGMRQSPIDINSESLDSFVVSSEIPLVSSYNTIQDAVVHWNGHAVEVDWASDKEARNCSITINGKRFNLVQFHFHTPSEHQIHGKNADAELHMVHRSPVGNSLAVVAILLHAQDSNVPFFQFLTELDRKVTQAKKKQQDTLHRQSNKTKNTKNKKTSADTASIVDIKLSSVDLTPLIKAIGNFAPRWEYSGSLTTPPCSENVAWSVMQHSFPIGLQQLRAAVDLEGYNARETHRNMHPRSDRI